MRKITVSIYRLCVIGLLFVSSSVMAQWTTQHTQYMAITPPVSISSVNNAGYMSTGSAFSSEVYDVGSDDPYSPPQRNLRKAGGPGTIEPGTGSDYDPNNPQFAPVGDSIIPLLMIALIYALMAFRRKSTKR